MPNTRKILSDRELNYIRDNHDKYSTTSIGKALGISNVKVKSELKAM